MTTGKEATKPSPSNAGNFPLLKYRVEVNCAS